MRSYIYLFAGLMVVSITGCNSHRGPEFKLSSQTQGLMPAARDAVRNELESAFGTPTRITVWRDLPIDFGTFEGTLSGPASNVLTVKLQPTGHIAATGRLASLSGSAVVKSGDNSRQWSVTRYKPDTQELEITGTDDKVIGDELKVGDAVTVVGDGIQFGRDLYLRHCMHCHGVSGDGEGPTAKYFAVKPRDYRRGVFKFTSTRPTIRPSRDDITRVVKLGIPGTYMPSFMLLPDEEVKAIVEYVRWLAMRGELEAKLAVELKNDFSIDAAKDKDAKTLTNEFGEYKEKELPSKVEGGAAELNEDWTAADDAENVVMPTGARVEPTSESIARGRQLFIGDKTKCASCHGETGRGNGVSTEDLNDVPGQPGVKSTVPGLFDIWGNVVRPRDLTSGIYRGGRRPLDIYRRISAGIKGTPMQAFGGTLKDEDIWDLTNYVLSVPFAAKSAKH